MCRRRPRCHAPHRRWPAVRPGRARVSAMPTRWRALLLGIDATPGTGRLRLRDYRRPQDDPDPVGGTVVDERDCGANPRGLAWDGRRAATHRGATPLDHSVELAR